MNHEKAWNDLEEWIKSTEASYRKGIAHRLFESLYSSSAMREVIRKMQEIEKKQK